MSASPHRRNAHSGSRRRAAWARTVFAASTLIMLGACAEHDMSDLEGYAQRVLARKGTRIDELPPVEPYEVYTYSSTEQVDPFEPFYQEQVPLDDAAQQAGRGGLQPDRTRKREELETYSLDSLRMMGTLELGDGIWGLVRDPDGTIHRVQVGNYMGRNHGKIIAVSEDRVQLNEIIQDGQGGWQERSAALALIE